MRRNILAIGIIFLVLFVITTFATNFLGVLPGDAIIRRPEFSFYFPFGTSVALSAAVAIVFWFLKRW